MKKTITFLLLSVLFLSSCSDEKKDCDDMIWDFTNYEFFISATNEAGENLFDPATEGNLLDKGIWISYEDKTYDIVKIGAVTRENMPFALALRYYSDHEYISTKFMMGFGEFSPVESYKGETFTIHWADGTSDEVSFDCYITWEDACNPDVHKSLYLNGKQLSDEGYPILTFVKKGKSVIEEQ